MNALLDKAIFAIRRLPEAEQEAIAREILECIEADARWDALFADPRSERCLDVWPTKLLMRFVAVKYSTAVLATGLRLEIANDA